MPSEGIVRFSQDIGCSFRAFVTRKKEHERTQHPIDPIDSPNDLPLFVEPCTGGRGQLFTKSTKSRLGSPLATSSVRQLELCFQLAVRFFLWKFWGSEFAKTRKKIADNAIHDKCSCNLARNPKLSGKQAVPALCRASLWTQRQAVHEEKPRLADNYCVNQWVYVNLCEPIPGFLDVLFETFFLLSVCRAKGISLESLNHWPAPLRLESCYAVSSEVARDKL